MKLNYLRVFAVMSAALIVPTVHAGVDLYAWDFSEAKSAKGYVDVFDSIDGNTISFKEGTALLGDPAVRGGKVVVFDGTQTAPALSLKNIPALNAIEFKLRFKASAETSAGLQTIMSLHGTYELRYNKERENLEFIVMYPENKYVIVRVPAPAGVWHQALATFKEGKLSLVVGMTSKEEMLPAGSAINARPAYLRVGRMGDRPFTGSIAEFSIGTP